MAKLEIESLEGFLGRICAEYQQTNTAPSGSILGDPVVKADGTSSLRLSALTCFQRGCPQNFGDFFTGVGGKTTHSMDKNDAYAWFARARLRYSCSTIAAKLGRFLVPMLQDRGVGKVFSTTLQKDVDLGQLEIYEILFAPRHQHTIVLESIFGTTTETVEALVEPLRGRPYCHHTVLLCQATGAIVDPTMGQFTGTMAPYVFQNLEDLKSVLPGDVVDMFPCSERGIQTQISRDNDAAQVSPDFAPRSFALRVLQSVREKKPHCWYCFGLASSKKHKLQRCSRCKKALYCSKECQVMNWKDCHKAECCVATEAYRQLTLNLKNQSN